MAKSYNSRGKIPALITYIIAVVFLILGLTLPIGVDSFTGGGIDFGKMPLAQTGGALAALGVNAGKLPFGSPLAPAFDFSVNLFGLGVNAGAIFLLLYLAVTVVCLAMLIPVCVAGKKSSAVRKIAAVMELVALAVLLPLCAISAAGAIANWNLSVFAALVVTALMLIVQSIVYFGKSGVIKTATFLISAATVVLTIANVADNLPFLQTPINSLVAGMKGSRPFETTAGLYLLDGNVYFGSTLLKLAFTTPAELNSSVFSTIVNYTALVLTILICVNLILDMLGLGKATTKFMLVSNIVRYSAEFILIITLYIAVFVALGSYGLSLYILSVFSLAQLIIALLRYRRYVRANAFDELEEDEFDEDADFADDDADYAFDDGPESGAQVETRNVYYNLNTIYNGPSDNFIRKLNNEEKIEFARLFLERTNENLSMIPDYAVGGDNTKFFSAIFIYLSRVRNVVTDGLMNKMYEEVTRLNG